MANNDNQMTRFLFAILRQKCLKDIDWNEVAKDPILSQPITNGHAARMRYSRFRSAMLGLEPQKRSKGGVTKNKSTKSKKDSKTKSDDTIKVETSDNKKSKKRSDSSPVIKQEKQAPTPFSVQFSPASLASPLTDASLMTPCSEDLLTTSPNLLMSPAQDLLSQGPFALGHCGHGVDHIGDGSQSQDPWADAPYIQRLMPLIA
ncbi:unnamed protein product [Parascedosporium putredinis]|uniref:Myb-like DNA-binding domain-containing protein n=1 Tax=Parascedosporium putredinis TaxID=1442378 RepID=A0A9P1GZ18_9PEZI|nr:unnamed protein product [Parascedosporium putredinis]CAI7990482.1 unnamed protein product [Parascedosporium putredinis]